jgi:hypothetical protein
MRRGESRLRKKIKIELPVGDYWISTKELIETEGYLEGKKVWFIIRGYE